MTTVVHKCTVSQYLGSGSDQIDLHLTYRLGHTTIGKILRKVCSALWDCLREESFPEFTENRWREIAEGFEKYSQFPNCLDAKYNFIYIGDGAFGKESDSTVFERSNLYEQLENNELHIPRGKPLPGTVSPNMPYMFVGDEAFSLSKNIMRPYSGKYLSDKKRIFNYSLSRARRNVESAFGILSNKWKIFHKPINANLDLSILLVKTCCALHNFVRARDEFKLVNTLYIEGSIGQQDF
ncbi:protein ALP1-like [Myzus persicae]|uniref:protein ALP1-like n=1 Tax=Myzus persicae TaxID=13164 RepID=UPI000B9328B5|nr:protein ALP1-like [Myzus persicae]